MSQRGGEPSVATALFPAEGSGGNFNKYKCER